MNKAMEGTLVRLAMGALAWISVASAAAAQDRSCERLRRTVEAAVPASVGSPAEVKRLLSPKTTPQFSRSFSVKAFEKTVRDELSAKITCSDRSEKALCGSTAPFTIYENPRGRSTLMVDLDRGRVLYANASRRFQGRANEVGKPDAEKLAVQAIADLGVPRAELGRVLTNAVMSASQSTERDSKPKIVRTEVNVRVLREIGGVPVYGSDGRIAVGATGEIARLQLSWPDFRLSEGLTPRAAHARAEMVASLMDGITQDNACGSIARVDAYVAYVPARDTESPGKADGTRDAFGFVPALVAIVTPHEPKEDSGRTTEAEQQLSLPLFAFGEENNADADHEPLPLRTTPRPAASPVRQ